MIIRTAIQCITCGQAHTVRIGMGQDNYQSHRFPCRSCHEDIEIGLEVDYENVSTRTRVVENAKLVEEVPDAPIVNVHANFAIPEDQQGKDLAFPHLAQMNRFAEVAEKEGSLVPVSQIPKDRIDDRPYRRPDYGDEWKELRKSWSLFRNGKTELSRKIMAAASSKYYSKDPLNDLQDWIWRFTLFLGQPKYEYGFRVLINEMKKINEGPSLNRLYDHYNDSMAEHRGTQYMDVFRSYFDAYSQYSQVQFSVVRGLDIPKTFVAGAVDFESTRMFYGTAFEHFSSLVDLLAYLNNLRLGREFDQFQTMSMADYLKLDKAGRFNPFAMNLHFTTFCEEQDNKLRNASHHGAFKFDAATQLISYREGKGVGGAQRELSYSMYLAKCSKIFMQSAALLRAEILMCHTAGIKMPI
jgi:hypothetical protein